MPWKVICPMEERMRFITSVNESDETFSELCARFGISRKTGYKWVERYEADGVAGLAEGRPVARSCPHRMPDELLNRVLELRKEHPTWGPKKLRARLLALGVEAVPASSTIGDALKKYGLVRSDGPGSPVGFEAFGKDGNIRLYSPLTAKRLPASQDVQPNGEPSALGAVPVEVTPVWVMTQGRDRSGNAVLYQYEVDSATEPPYAFEYRITTIEYTAGVDDKGEIEEAPKRKVVFEYSTPAERPDPIFQYQNGVRRSVTRRLLRIKLMAPNPVLLDSIAQYALAYEVGPERSFLESVHRLDDSGWRRMWERRFEWAHDTRPHFQVVEVPGLAGAFHESAPIVFDGDNDGRDDLMIDGKFCRTTGGSHVPFNTCVSGDVTAGIWGRPADVNGDGKADILRKTAAGVAFATWNDATGTFESLAYGLAPNSNLIDADGDSLLDAYTVGPRVNPNVDYYEHEWSSMSVFTPATTRRTSARSSRRRRGTTVPWASRPAGGSSRTSRCRRDRRAARSCST